MTDLKIHCCVILSWNLTYLNDGYILILISYTPSANYPHRNRNVKSVLGFKVSYSKESGTLELITNFITVKLYHMILKALNQMEYQKFTSNWVISFTRNSYVYIVYKSL
jgi:hypothetical protein